MRTLAVVLKDQRSGPDFAPHRATLEDAYHVAVAGCSIWLHQRADTRHGQLDGLLDFAAQTSPNARRTQVDGVTLVHDNEALAESVRRSGDIAGSLSGMFGEDDAKRYLGPPNAVDLHVQDDGTSGERWTWQGGGWQPQDAKPVPRGISTKNGRLVWTDVPASSAASILMLDDWPAYERGPKDNMASGRAQRKCRPGRSSFGPGLHFSSLVDRHRHIHCSRGLFVESAPAPGPSSAHPRQEPPPETGNGTPKPGRPG